MKSNLVFRFGGKSLLTSDKMSRELHRNGAFFRHAAVGRPSRDRNSACHARGRMIVYLRMKRTVILTFISSALLLNSCTHTMSDTLSEGEAERKAPKIAQEATKRTEAEELAILKADKLARQMARKKAEEARILKKYEALMAAKARREAQEEASKAQEEASKAQEEANKAQEEVLQYKHQIIQFMLNEGDTDDKIQRATGLSLEEIAKVRSGMSE